MKRFWLLLLCILTVSLSACAHRPDIRPEYVRGDKLTPEEVLVVGRFDISPALGKDEQRFDGDADEYRNRIFLYLNEEPAPVGLNGMAINPELSKTFFFKIPRNAVYLVGGHLWLVWTRDAYREIKIPMALKLDVRPGDTAIYIGSFKVARDEFNGITKAEIIDDYTAASKEFASKFGSNQRLRKVIATGL